MFKSKKSLIFTLLILLIISIFTACSSDFFQPETTTVGSDEKETESITESSSSEKKTTLSSAVSKLIKDKTTKKKKSKLKKEESTSASTTESTIASSSVEETATHSNKEKATIFPKLKNKKREETEEKEKNFFDNAVFIGDSVSLGLKNYATNQRNNGKECLGKAQFLVAGCMGYTNSLGAVGKQNTIHPKYNGKEVMVDDGVKMIGAKKAFIMLGLNDFCAYPLETSMKNAKIFIGRIVEKNPGIKIYVQSVTPVISAKERGKFNNDSINKFNEALIELCYENGWTYVDVASVMKNENGCFKDEYCCDKNAQGVHMTYSGYRAWVEYLNNKF